ncbi:MAG: right-handed parallel beta-helix repeat-containing protein, partial [Lentisphaerae bacterium]|nr:right-handed parallel beta-helix repeat-containing protein [Lentisphaerota bacterium]
LTSVASVTFNVAQFGSERYNAKMFRALILIAVLWLVQVACAGEFFVSTNGSDVATGLSRSNAWATIQHAVDNITTGDIVTVTEGAYAGFRAHVTATADAPIIVRADVGASVVLNTEGAQNVHHCIVDIATKTGSTIAYWTIEGFEVANSSVHGIGIYGLEQVPIHHITVRSNVVHDSAYTGIFTGFTDDLLIENNRCYLNGEHGIYCSNSGDRPVVRANRCSTNTSSGIQFNGDLSIGGDGTISDVVVDSNVLYGNGSTGGAAINLDGVDGGDVINNLIVNQHATGIALFQGNGAIATRNVRVIHNTVLTAGGGRWAIDIADASGVSNTVLNNILYTDHTWRGSISAAFSAIQGLVCDYNIVMDRFSIDGGSTRITFDEWQALGYDRHSFIASPVGIFADAGADDYHLTESSPGVDDGQAAPPVSDDIESTPRVYGCSPDIGAYEWIP